MNVQFRSFPYLLTYIIFVVIIFSALSPYKWTINFGEKDVEIWKSGLFNKKVQKVFYKNKKIKQTKNKDVLTGYRYCTFRAKWYHINFDASSCAFSDSDHYHLFFRFPFRKCLRPTIFLFSLPLPSSSSLHPSGGNTVMFFRSSLSSIYLPEESSSILLPLSPSSGRVFRRSSSSSVSIS